MNPWKGKAEGKSECSEGWFCAIGAGVWSWAALGTTITSVPGPCLFHTYPQKQQNCISCTASYCGTPKSASMVLLGSLVAVAGVCSGFPPASRMRTGTADLTWEHVSWQIAHEGLQLVAGLRGARVQVSVSLTPFLVIPRQTSSPPMPSSQGPRSELQRVSPTFSAVSHFLFGANSLHRDTHL